MTKHDITARSLQAQPSIQAAYQANPLLSPTCPRFSIIAPVHNEELVLAALYQQVSQVMAETGEDWELILVDDGSTDRSAVLIEQLHQQDPRVRGLSFSRNFGFQVAVTAGLEHARGDAVILIDADLQDPPEVILQMIEKWCEGFEVVYGVRGERDGETWFKRTSASLFYRIIQRMTNVEIPADTGDFRLMDRRVVEAVLKMPEQHRFLRGMVSWVGYRQTGVVYHRQARYAGKTNFTLQKMIRFALDAVTSFSYLPLQLATYLGVALVGLGGLAVIAVILLSLFGLTFQVVWPVVILCAVCLIGGVQLISLGIIGEYLGRMYDEMKSRPLYLVRQQWGMEK